MILWKGDPKESKLNKMKRERKQESMKGHGKHTHTHTHTHTQDQTNKEELDSLPEKEFRVRIVKLIQTLRNKMEAQKSRMETQIEKIQEMFKYQEEIKNNQQ